MGLKRVFFPPECHHVIFPCLVFFPQHRATSHDSDERLICSLSGPSSLDFCCSPFVCHASSSPWPSLICIIYQFFHIQRAGGIILGWWGWAGTTPHGTLVFLVCILASSPPSANISGCCCRVAQALRCLFLVAPLPDHLPTICLSVFSTSISPSPSHNSMSTCSHPSKIIHLHFGKPLFSHRPSECIQSCLGVIILSSSLQPPSRISFYILSNTVAMCCLYIHPEQCCCHVLLMAALEHSARVLGTKVFIYRYKSTSLVV